MTDVTQILNAIEQGDPTAAEQLAPLVYDELRKLAAQKMAQEASGQTLQATALVHEAYVRLVDVEKAEGIKQAKILVAEGEAEAIRLVNEAANTYFVGNAQLLRKLEALEKALSENAKIVMPSGSELVNVIGEMAGVLPLTEGAR